MRDNQGWDQGRDQGRRGEVAVAYLDHAASTPVRPEVLEAMLPCLRDGHANPSGVHRLARAARRCLDEARESIAADLGCAPGEVVLTSGGTESDNLAVRGVHARSGGSLVVSAVEHHAVLRPAEELGALVAPVDGAGAIDLAALEALLDPAVRLVSVMLVNSEVGVVEPVDRVVGMVRALAPAAVVHTDAVQAPLWLDVAAATAGCDLVSVTAHKLGGPRGIGALVVREGAREAMAPLFGGGSQEWGLRPGTENVAGAVGMAVALRAATRDRDAVVARVGALRDRLADGLVALGALEPPGRRAARVVGNAHVRFPGVEAEELLLLLDREGVAASAGSACASGAHEPSHVLTAMGWSPAAAREAVRFTLGWTTTAGDVERLLAVLPGLVERLGGVRGAVAPA
ncbi:MAG: cysteine desulfurase family protein [Actinomycetota bacterium]|nr:cysteine desulfurase family protein [Actinomycetota bacterium]